ncbi:hypothetical protein TWF694_010376 [Orbilia ellipsospora]|uniref:DUF2428 domain-containing protein n=1 Tax=Orbilia ellipsospora TaxID=2528407 RepID=A0AAV9XAZ1_9PEZI
MESLDAIESTLSEYETSSRILPEETLLSLREKLIKLNIKDSAQDCPKTIRYLKQWILPLLATGSNSKIESGVRLYAVDALSIVFTRLGGAIKVVEVDIKPTSCLDKSMGSKCITIFRDFFDQATPPLLKSLKDCLTAFIALGNESWKFEERQKFSLSIAGEVFDGAINGDFRKGDLYLLEFLIKKKWLSSKSLLSTVASDGETPSVINLSSIFKMMGNRTLAPGIGRLLGSLLRRFQDELAVDVEPQHLKQLWLDHFKEVLAKSLFSIDEQTALNTELYAVPGIFQDEKEGLAIFIRYLLEIHHSSQEYQHSIAIIGCLRTGKEYGWLSESQVDEYVNSLGGYDSLLSDQYSLLRAQTLRLMLISSSMAYPLSSAYFQILKIHLDDFFAEPEPQVRNEIYSAFRVLFERLVASSYALNKRLQSFEKRPQEINNEHSNGSDTLRNQLVEHKSFITWFLSELLPSQLHQNASYQRVVLALKVYSFWLPQIDRDTSNPRPGSDLTSDVKKSRKKQTDREHIVLPFDPEIEYPSLLRLLAERIIDPYDDIRSLAAGLIKELRQSNELPWPQILQRAQKLIEHSGRPGQGNGLSRILEVLHDLSLKDANVAREIWESYDSNISDKTIVDLAFMLLEREPQAKCENNLRSQIDNSVIGALALIYKRKDAAKLFGNTKQGQNILDSVLNLTRNIWSREREILCNESPEGRGGLLSGDDSDDEEEDQLNSQGFLSYSWRVVSEASSLLGAISKYTTLAYSETRNADAFLKSAGELLIEQLTSIRHRGSLSSIFPALTAMCFQCLTSASPSAQKLPQIWLDTLLSIVSTSGKSITRRSAGLPMAMGAILISEIQSKKKQTLLLDHAFKSLQAIVSTQFLSEDPGNDHLELPQVHALNCMRFLFMDSQLAMAIDPYVASSLGMAFSCFKSEIWAVRNCGIMLYTAIVNRIFPRDGSNQLFKGERFFERYSDLADTFLETLSDGFRDLNDHRLVEAVYPALDVISRLSFMEVGETEDSISSRTQAFKDLVMRYLGCKIWKIREAAAKSILAFTHSREHALEFMRSFLIWSPEDEPRGNNLMHGSISAAREIYEQRLVGSSDIVQQAISDILLKASDVILGRDTKVSPINKALFVQLNAITSSEGGDILIEKVVPFCQMVLFAANGAPSKNFADSLLHKEIAKALAMVRPEVAVGLLSFGNPDYGISLSETLCERGESLDLSKPLREAAKFTDNEGQFIESIREEITPIGLLWDILNNHPWERYRVAAVNLLHLSSDHKASNPETLSLLVSASPVEPLRESALVLMGRNLHLVAEDENVAAQLENFITSWIEQLFRHIHDDMPFSSRMAALKSIKAAIDLFRRSSAQDISSALLPVWIILHKLLNDDDDDIRILSAELTVQLLALEQLASKDSVTSLQTERKLFSHLAATDAASKPLMRQYLLDGILDTPVESPDDIKTQLIQANTPNTLLFKIEKQNLYRDDVRCMRYYLDILSSTTSSKDSNVESRLVRYVTMGMDTLWDIAQEYQAMEAGDGGVSINAGKLRAADGIMGWTTATEEIFVLGMRIAHAFQLLMKWYAGTEKASQAEWKVRRFVDYGEREDVGINNMWLKAFRGGIIA